MHIRPLNGDQVVPWLGCIIAGLQCPHVLAVLGFDVNLEGVLHPVQPDLQGACPGIPRLNNEPSWVTHITVLKPWTTGLAFGGVSTWGGGGGGRG